MHKMKPKVKIFDTLKRLSVLLLALTMSFTAHASSQQGILIYKGTVTDSNSAPVEYATVAIVNAQGAVLAGTAANEDGSYVMKAVKSVDSVDDLRLVCSFVGYKEFNCKDVFGVIANVTASNSPSNSRDESSRM